MKVTKTIDSKIINACEKCEGYFPFKLNYIRNYKKNESIRACNECTKKYLEDMEESSYE